MEREQIIALTIAGIEFCLSIACMVMGGVHLNECQNQAAIFLLVNGGLTLLIIAIVGITFYSLTSGECGYRRPCNCDCCDLFPYCLIGVAVLVKLGLSIYGSVVIFGKFETQIHNMYNLKYSNVCFRIIGWYLSRSNLYLCFCDCNNQLGDCCGFHHLHWCLLLYHVPLGRS